ncbi:universal stress protein [soil metagenome]
MPHTTGVRPVIVGIDGSKGAIEAAIWAIDEALDLDTSLRLVYVIDAAATDHPEADYRRARLALREAQAAVEATGQPVRVGSAIVCGNPAEALVEASRDTPLVCLGATGMRNSAPDGDGATGTTIAEAAFGPVAIVRHRYVPSERWVVAVLDESPVSAGVLRTAMDEARRRHSPLLVLTSWPTHALVPGAGGTDFRAEIDRLLDESDQNATDVHVSAERLSPNLTQLLAQTVDIDQLVIVGRNNPELITELIGPQARSLLSHTNCSVMVFRDAPNAAPDEAPDLVVGPG